MMANDADLMKLYSKRILALVVEIPHTTPLDAPDGEARKRSPLCGSTVNVQLSVRDSRISEFGQDVKACALGQASAAVIGKHIIGQSHDEVKALRAELLAMLKSDGPVPSAPFDELEVLKPARDFKNRHPSIMLTVEAIDEAFAQALGTTEKDTA